MPNAYSVLVYGSELGCNLFLVFVAETFRDMTPSVLPATMPSVRDIRWVLELLCAVPCVHKCFHLYSFSFILIRVPSYFYLCIRKYTHYTSSYYILSVISVTELFIKPINIIYIDIYIFSTSIINSTAGNC